MHRNALRDLKSLRLEAGLSQDQVAVVAGVDRAVISRVERKLGRMRTEPYLRAVNACLTTIKARQDRGST